LSLPLGRPPHRPARPARLGRAGSLELGDERFRMFEVGGDGPLILLAGGWLGRASHWRPLLQWLGEREQRAVALDLPGLGHRAAKGSVFDQTNEVIGAALRQLAEPADQGILVGHSLGAAAVAVYEGEQRDAQVAGLGLCAAGADDAVAGAAGFGPSRRGTWATSAPDAPDAGAPHGPMVVARLALCRRASR
jgi:pimeloyl-ACP methyl ester carboxylesterase